MRVVSNSFGLAYTPVLFSARLMNSGSLKGASSRIILPIYKNTLVFLYHANLVN